IEIGNAMARVGLTRERLVAAACEMADREGFETLTLAGLARHFGIRLASLYAHVRNLEDLRRAVALAALEALADRADAAVAGRAGGEALVALAEVHRDFSREHPGLFTASRHPLDAETAARSGGMRLSRSLAAALRDYRLSETDQVHAIRLVGSFFLGFALLENAGSFSHSAPEPDQSWNRNLAAIDATLRSWAQP